jgi:hypothetical protein
MASSNRPENFYAAAAIAVMYEDEPPAVGTRRYLRLDQTYKPGSVKLSDVF